MMEVGKFNINNLNKPVNKTLTVVFSPYQNVKTFTYEIYKNNKLITSSVPSVNKSVSIVLNETGEYIIKINATFQDGTTSTLSSNKYIIDKEKPEIIINESSLNIKTNEIDKIIKNASAKDNLDKNVNSKIKTNINSLNKKIDKTQKLIYTVEDSAGNINSKEININFIQNNSYMFIIQSIIVSITLIILYFINKYRKALKLEKRIEPFTVKSLKESELSLSEKLIKKYQNITKKISKNFDKSIFVKKYSKKLEKYLPVTNIHKTVNDIFAGKIITAFIFVIIAFIIQLFRFKLLEFYEIILIFTFGFFVLDILYFIKYKVFRWKLESDFIAAITIMNNAFKSGRSITQAIETVSEELSGTMGREFNKMSLELLYGLELEVVFKRFAQRINLEEASYLTASLTILNKTGGDIIKVFDSIERNMFDKRKLRLELASLTSGSKIVVGVLLGMPFFFCLVICLINPDYFIPFFTTTIGIILLIFMLIYYIIFIVVVRKIMKVVI